MDSDSQDDKKWWSGIKRGRYIMMDNSICKREHLHLNLPKEYKHRFMYLSRIDGITMTMKLINWIDVEWDAEKKLAEEKKNENRKVEEISNG